VPLLDIRQVSFRFTRGPRDAPVLCDASLTVERGELIAVWGAKRSGRTTFLQLMAGARLPSTGTVSFDGSDLAKRPMLGVARGIGYAIPLFDRTVADSVREHVATPLLGAGVSRELARERADEELARAGAPDCRDLDPLELDHAETSRVAIARALVTRPSLLLLDEPTYGLPPARERDAVLSLIRSLTHDDGLAVVMTTSDAADLAGADRALTLDGGRLRGDTASARETVIPLRRAASSGGASGADGSSPDAGPR
jgi:energy-coupling factor transporter ATP-binding protein EcfA2